jgi:hypothetical protein
MVVDAEAGETPMAAAWSGSRTGCTAEGDGGDEEGSSEGIVVQGKRAKDDVRKGAWEIGTAKKGRRARRHTARLC